MRGLEERLLSLIKDLEKEKGLADKRAKQLFITSCACRAYRNAAWDIPNATTTKIPYDAEDYDVGGDFDADGSDSNFTVPATDYYFITATAKVTALSADKTLELHIYVDGSPAASYTKKAGSTGTQGVSISSVLYLTAAEVIDIRIFQNEGSTRALDVGSADSFVCIHRL